MLSQTAGQRVARSGIRGKLEVKSFYSSATKRWAKNLLNNNCKVKGKMSNGIQDLVILQKGEYSCECVDKTLLVCFSSS